MTGPDQPMAAHPLLCENCGKTMAKHGPAANCWGPGASPYPGVEAALAVQQPKMDPNKVARSLIAAAHAGRPPEGRAGQEDAALRRGGATPAPPGSETKIYVEHTVSFHLGEAEQFVVPRRGTRGYVRVDAITVRLLEGRQHQVWAGGIVCKKDGLFSESWGRTSVSVDVPNMAQWIERALTHIGGCDITPPESASNVHQYDGTGGGDA